MGRAEHSGEEEVVSVLVEKEAGWGEGGRVKRQGCCRDQRSAVSRKSPGRAWTPPC